MAKWWEDRTSQQFKAQEAFFYSECAGKTTRIEEYKEITKSSYASESDKLEARKKIKELDDERQMLIDEWKEEHGEYDIGKAYYTKNDGSTIPGYGYWSGWEEQTKKEAQCECEDEEEYGM